MAMLQRFKLRASAPASATPASSSGSRAEEIARAAYELYARRGYSHGRDLDDWLEAEQIVAKRRAGEKLRAR